MKKKIVPGVTFERLRRKAANQCAKDIGQVAVFLGVYLRDYLEATSTPQCTTYLFWLHVGLFFQLVAVVILESKPDFTSLKNSVTLVKVRKAA